MPQRADTSRNKRPGHALRDHKFLAQYQHLFLTAAGFEFTSQGTEIALRRPAARGEHSDLAVDVCLKLIAAAADAANVERPGGRAAEVALEQFFQQPLAVRG